jgi:D-galacturonate reductase
MQGSSHALQRQLTGGNLQELVANVHRSEVMGVPMAGGGTNSPLDVLMIGTGEYTTGYVHGTASDSDKGAGVVALTMFDLRRRGKVGRLGLCGTNGSKIPGIRGHMQHCIGQVYRGLDLTMDSWPEEDKVDPEAYEKALDCFKPGDACTIFTPDDTHFRIAMASVKRGLHTMVTKPVVKTLKEHRELYEAAQEAGVLVMVEVHKRFDPIYIDAKDRIQGLGSFSHMYAYMSQPKHQLDTFRAWAGKSSDISYYLNSHHIDFQEWAMQGKARPLRVVAMGSTGVAKSKGIETEDTITLMVQWENMEDGSLGSALYTSSWVAPKSDVHSQQRFFYMGQKGEIQVDQAHRGYSMSKDGEGYRSVNPLFFKYTPDASGNFTGQSGYGYRRLGNPQSCF